MLNLIFVLFAIIALLFIVAIAIDYFPGRSRRRRDGSGGYWHAPEVYDHNFSDHRGPDHHHDDNDGGWFDGGGDFDAGD